MTGHGKQLPPPKQTALAGPGTGGGAGQGAQNGGQTGPRSRGDYDGGGLGDFGGGGRNFHTHIDGRNFARGRWGQDGYGTFGDRTHRGASSTGGGRGDGYGNGFNAPTGPFVEGAMGLLNHKRPPYRTNHGVRGGGRRP
ncbi:hypothetical protein D1007_18042 [Hordeum vulgare]|nr:hypothetical protein D1007_18042 [Hordeum vulgare]